MNTDSIKRCNFCGEEYEGPGAEHLKCGLKHPFLALLGWGLLGIEKLFLLIGWIFIQISRIPRGLRSLVELWVSKLGDKYYCSEEKRSVPWRLCQTTRALILYPLLLWFAIAYYKFGLPGFEYIRYQETIVGASIFGALFLIQAFFFQRLYVRFNRIW